MVVAMAKTEEALLNITNMVLQRISAWMQVNDFQLAPEITEAVLLTTKRNVDQITFNIQGTLVHPGKTIKHLGVWLDTKLTFAEHINRAVEKAERPFHSWCPIL
ncbi:hypothetical protein Trydic_g13999 [Trypoxylus dichotomus]